MKDIKMIAMGCKPDPYKFEIVKIGWISNHTIIEAKYDGCLSFGGHKLMLLKGYWDKEDYAVIGRFIPNELGWDMARASAVASLDSDN